MPEEPAFDLAVIGGGIVGLATAYQLQRLEPTARVVVLEKEGGLGVHQTGHNSGVLHTGLYYRPGSLKARTCQRGRALLEAFCAAHALPARTCGKVIVATTDAEVGRLDDLLANARANGVEARRLDPRGLREVEPHATGRAALHVPGAGVVDFRRVCGALAEEIRAAGGEIRLEHLVLGLRRQGAGVRVETARGSVLAGRAVNCAGLHSDRIAHRRGRRPEIRILPFRGEYFRLRPEARHLCHALIYPTPDPALPFLGAHLTRTLDGEVLCGPNAVLATAREGYRRRDFQARDLWQTLTWPGSYRMALRHGRAGAAEAWRSWSRRAFLRALRRLVPEIRAEHLERAPAGVRAQAVARSGDLLDDFLLDRDGPVLHVLNAPSPAATASLAIGEVVAAELLGS